MLSTSSHARGGKQRKKDLGKTYEIRGVNVHFPFDAYNCQKIYMEKVISALHNSENALLESPTGTGKTLCLLCAVLAWRKDILQRRNMTAGPNGFHLPASNSSAATLARGIMNPGGAMSGGGGDSSKMSSAEEALKNFRAETQLGFVPYRIIYASRTHSQLQQVVKELKNTQYSPSVSILSSRAQSCIHPDVMRAQTNSMKNTQCRMMIQQRECRFYNKLESEVLSPSCSSHIKADLESKVLDIEDLVRLGKHHGFCPYYYSQKTYEQSDMVLMPYNYLIDPRIRRTLKENLVKDSVLIFDEAHNLESVCSEAASFDLTANTISSVISELIAAQKFYDKHPEDLKAMGIGPKDANILNAILKDLEKVVDSITVGSTFPGDHIVKILAKVEVAKNNVEFLMNTCKKLEDVLQKYGEKDMFNTETGASLSYFRSFLSTIFEDENSRRHYRVHVHLPKSNNEKKKSFFGNARKKGPTLSYWCFSSGLAMQALAQGEPRSIILTSGTLSPMTSFAAELETKFPVQLENPHVISSKQVWVGVISRGPTNEVLDSSYRNRENMKYRMDLGITLVNIANIVPDGILVFFPSYTVMNDFTEFWKVSQNGRPSIFQRIEQRKKILMEGRGGAEFAECQEAYRQEIRSGRGCVLMAVTRGKISEGLDFSDRNGRAVVIVGLPFPSLVDPRVKLKRSFLDENLRNQRISNASGGSKRGQQNDLKLLTGSEWYTQQASRAVNQAIGRVIRHRNDFGAIIFADQRFGKRQNQDRISKWIRPHMQKITSFGQVGQQLSKFFKVTTAPWLHIYEDKVRRIKRERGGDVNEEDLDVAHEAPPDEDAVNPAPSGSIFKVQGAGSKNRYQAQRHGAVHPALAKQYPIFESLNPNSSSSSKPANAPMTLAQKEAARREQREKQREEAKKAREHRERAVLEEAKQKCDEEAKADKARAVAKREGSRQFMQLVKENLADQHAQKFKDVLMSLNACKHAKSKEAFRESEASFYGKSRECFALAKTPQIGYDLAEQFSSFVPPNMRSRYATKVIKHLESGVNTSAPPADTAKSASSSSTGARQAPLKSHENLQKSPKEPLAESQNTSSLVKVHRSRCSRSRSHSRSPTKPSSSSVDLKESFQKLAKGVSTSEATLPSSKPSSSAAMEDDGPANTSVSSSSSSRPNSTSIVPKDVASPGTEAAADDGKGDRIPPSPAASMRKRKVSYTSPHPRAHQMAQEPETKGVSDDKSIDKPRKRRKVAVPQGLQPTSQMERKVSTSAADPVYKAKRLNRDPSYFNTLIKSHATPRQYKFFKSVIRKLQRARMKGSEEAANLSTTFVHLLTLFAEMDQTARKSSAAMKDEGDEDDGEAQTELDFSTLVGEFEAMVPDSFIDRYRVCIPEDPVMFLRQQRHLRRTTGNEKDGKRRALGGPMLVEVSSSHGLRSEAVCYYSKRLKSEAGLPRSSELSSIFKI